ncbi:hypothetical protein ACF0H5_001012 [Mactra antiquata]
MKEMTVVKKCVILSAVLAALSTVFQTISFIIPGWLMTETKTFSLNMALWYVIYCDLDLYDSNSTEHCEAISYHKVFTELHVDVPFFLGATLSSITRTQAQVTACLVLTICSLLLVAYQLITFRKQRTGQPTIYDDEPKGTCNLRAKFLYSGGFSAVFQLFSGILLVLIVIDFAKRHYAHNVPRPHVPYTLFIAGFAVVCSGLCVIIELSIAFRTKERHCLREMSSADGKTGNDHQLHPLNQTQGQGHHGDSYPRNMTVDQTTDYDGGDYYGQDYDVENPAFRSQGTRKMDAATKPFPGYRLGRHNLQGHDQKWWRKVTFAAMPLYL